MPEFVEYQVFSGVWNVSVKSQERVYKMLNILSKSESEFINLNVTA